MFTVFGLAAAADGLGDEVVLDPQAEAVSATAPMMSPVVIRLRGRSFGAASPIGAAVPILEPVLESIWRTVFTPVT
jgi:hypothetical protein